MTDTERHSTAQPDENAQLYDILARAGFRGRDAHLFNKLVEDMASANLIYRFESKLDALAAETGTRIAEMAARLDAQLGAQNARLDAQLGALNAKMEAQLGAQNAKIDEQLGAQNAKIDEQLGAQNAKIDALNAKIDTRTEALSADFRFVKWGISLILGLITAAGVAVTVLDVLPV